MASQMPQRNLGRNGPAVSAIGLGCMGLSAFYGSKADNPQDVLKRSIELGCTFWDTADIYADNEIELSKILKDRRKEVFLATKFAITSEGPCGKPEYVRAALDKSLGRLGVDYVDLYYMHRMDPNTPVEETIKAMAGLVKEGKVRHIGLSECSEETLRKAHAIHPVSAVQVEYSPWTLDMEHNGVKKACEELGIAFIAYSPLGRGFLAGRFKTFDDLDADDWRRTNPRFQGENFNKNLELVKELEQFAAKKNITSSQLCLAWVLHQGDNIIPIPGTTSIKRLEENCAAAQVKLSQDDLAEIRKIIDKVPIVGTRYAEQMMKMLGK